MSVPVGAGATCQCHFETSHQKTLGRKNNKDSIAHLNDSSLACSKSFRRFHQQKAIKRRSNIPRTDARAIVKIKKRGEGAVGELDWRVPVEAIVGEVAGETVDEKAPGSRAVVFTVDLWCGVVVNGGAYAAD